MLYKKICKAAIVLILSVFLNNTYAYANTINIYVNENKIEKFLNKPFILDDVVMIPVNDISYATNIVLKYVSVTDTYTLINNKNELVIKPNEHTAILNDETINLDYPAKNINNKLFVPIKLLENSFGFECDFDQNTVYIDTKKAMPVVDTVVDDKKVTVVEQNFDHILKEDKLSMLAGIIDKSTEIFNTEDHELATITSIENNNGIFTIKSNLPISSVDKSILNGKLIFNINNSNLNVPIDNFKPENIFVTQVSSKFLQNENTNTTNVVFDLADNVSFKVTYSEDRKNIFIIFTETAINDFKVERENNSDVIFIDTNIFAAPAITYKTSPDRMIIDYNQATLSKMPDNIVDCNFVTSTTAEQVTANHVRFTLFLNKPVDFKSFRVHDQTIIKLSEPTFKNISYDSTSKKLILKKDLANPLDISIFKTTDSYVQKKLVLDLNTSYDFYGYGTFRINDNYISTIDIGTESTTKFTFNQNTLTVTKVEEDDENYYIYLLPPKEVYPLVIVLDAGHGGKDSGAVGHGLYEKTLNTDIVDRVYDLINANGTLKAYLTKEGDTFISLGERANIGNEVGDIFVSFHNNASPKSWPRGTEVYYMNHSNDAAIGFTSYQMAVIMQKHLVSALQSEDRGAKFNDLHVLRNTNIPAVLLEIGFISNMYDAELLAKPEYRQLAAEAIFNSLIEISSIYKP